jgi:geranylgeranylglyceryl phosphate synthase family protein
MPVYEQIQALRQAGRKGLAVLVDPDKTSAIAAGRILALAERAGVDFFLVGGSLLMNDEVEACVEALKAGTIPVIMFPGDPQQIMPNADAVLLLSLISGRNPDLLIGRHVAAAARLKASGLEIIPTGYILIDGGTATSVSYMSGTMPIPAQKNDIAVSTAIAGEMLGLKLLYLEAGSGAKEAVPAAMIEAVRKQVSIPLFVGGGIRTPEKARLACEAGADIIVIGTAIEENEQLIEDMAIAVHSIPVKTKAL